MQVETLLKQIAGINLALHQCRAPKIADGEIVAGVMSDDLKRVYHLREQLIEVLRVSEEPIKYKVSAHSKECGEDHCFSEEKCSAFHAEIHFMLEEIHLQRVAVEAIDEIFWGWMKFEFPVIQGKTNMGICEGYTVVCSKEENPPFIVVEVLNPSK